jgi:hypothetical protein
MIFTPSEINHNPLRQQGHQFVLILQDPRSIQNTNNFSTRPPRIRTHLKGDEAWNPWWRTTLLVQSLVTMPFPTLEDSNGEPTSYLHNVLQQALLTSTSLLSSIRGLQTSHAHATNVLRAAPDGSFIISHAKKGTSSQYTNFVISVKDPVAYAMLATQTDPIKTCFNTFTTSKE